MRTISRQNLPTAPDPKAGSVDAPKRDDQTVAMARVEDLSKGYVYDLWNLAYLIARERGPKVQRTIEDIDQADRKLRTGFTRRKTFRRCFGLTLNTVGSLAAAFGGTTLWTGVSVVQQSAGGRALSFLTFILGTIAAVVGIWLAYGSE